MQRRLLLEQLARMTARARWCKVGFANTGAFQGVGRGESCCRAGSNLHRDGYGFVRPNAGRLSRAGRYFIPPNEINGAMQGTSAVRMEPPKADGRRMGRIVRVIERRNPTVVGVFLYARSDRHSGIPWCRFDERMTQPILIPRA